MTTGRIIPKSMSIQEAANYLADPINWQPALDESGDGEYQEEQLEFEGEEDPPPTETPAELRVETSPIRAMDALEADIDIVCGTSALAIPPEQRHLATLNLIEDLISARQLLDDYKAVMLAMRAHR